MSGETINFMLAAVPNLADREATQFVAGGEVAGSPVTNLATRRMGEFWRAPSLKPRHTQFTMDLAAAELSRALFLGNIGLPEAGSRVRVRKGADVTDEWVRPLWRTNGDGDSLLAATNATGSISDLDGDPYAPTSWVEPTTPASAMSFRVPLRPPPSAPAEGAMLQAVQVAYGTEDVVAAGSSITVEIWQDGSQVAGLTLTEDAFAGPEEDVWVAELKFDAADLTDPGGALLEVKVATDPSGPSIRIGAVRWLATVEREVALPAISTPLLESTNAESSDVTRITETDPLDPLTSPVGIAPTVAASALELRMGFEDPGALTGEAGEQQFVVKFEPTAAGNPSLSATLYLDGTPTAVTDSAAAAAGLNFLILPFSASDLGASPAADVELRLVTTPDGSNNIRVLSAGWRATTTAARYSYDTGWLELWPANTGSLWGVERPSGGKSFQRTFALPFFDGSGAVLDLETRFTRVEFLLSAAGPWEFDDPETGDTITWFDLGRYAEGPALTGPYMAGGYEIEVVDPSSRDESDGGVLWEDDERCYRIARLTLTHIDVSVALPDLIDHWFMRAGTSLDVLVILFPESANYQRHAHVWGPLERMPRTLHDFGQKFRTEISARERT